MTSSYIGINHLCLHRIKQIDFVTEVYFYIAYAWQDLEGRNITFTDELDFEIEELEFIYKRDKEND